MRDDTEVYVDLINSEAARNIAKQPQLISFVKEALRDKELTGTEMYFEYDLGRVVGYDLIIDAPNDDGIFYAQVLREDTYTRFIKGGKPLPTRYVAVGLRRSIDGSAYELQDVRIGRLSPPRPGMLNETSASRQYWATHAVVQDGQVLQLRTVTKKCPY
jgi:hypothetical protein